MKKIDMAIELTYEAYGRPIGVIPTPAHPEVKANMRLTKPELERKMKAEQSESEAR